MRVQRNETNRIELLKREVEGKLFYSARLYDDFKEVPVVRTEENSNPLPSYDCEMVTTPNEMEFVDDTQAQYYFNSNFDKEYTVAKYIEEYDRKRQESNEARAMLVDFDYPLFKAMEELIFTDITLEELRFKYRKAYGLDFHEIRNKQRAVVKGRASFEK